MRGQDAHAPPRKRSRNQRAREAAMLVQRLETQSLAAPWTAAALSRGLRAFRAHSPHRAGHGPCVTGLALFKLVDVSAKKLAESPMTVSKGGGHCPHELPSHAAVPWPPAWTREGAELMLAIQPLCTQRALAPNRVLHAHALVGQSPVMEPTSQEPATRGVRCARELPVTWLPVSGSAQRGGRWLKNKDHDTVCTEKE